MLWAQKLEPLRVADDIDDLRPIDEHEPILVKQDVERGQVAMGPPRRRQREQRVAELFKKVR